MTPPLLARAVAMSMTARRSVVDLRLPVPSLNDGLVRVVAVEGVGLGVGLGGRRDGWCRVRGWFR